MNLSSFNISLTEIEKTLNEFGLLKSTGVKSINKDDVSQDFKSASKRKEYRELFLIGLQNFDYDFLLNDQSYFQFQLRIAGKSISLRYAFYQNPTEYKTYIEFLTEEIVEKGYENNLDEIGDNYLQEYDQFLNELENNNNFLTFRYDCDIKGYKPLIHSTAHLHIGHKNNMRIPINKLLSPLKFTLFIIKHVYHNEWKSKVNIDIKYIESRLSLARKGMKNLDNSSWEIKEALELHII